VKQVLVTNREQVDMTLMIEPYGRWYVIPAGRSVLVRSEKYDLGSDIEISVRRDEISIWVEGGPHDFLSDLEVTLTDRA